MSRFELLDQKVKQVIFYYHERVLKYGSGYVHRGALLNPLAVFSLLSAQN
jgi:hypothetical protein